MTKQEALRVVHEYSHYTGNHHKKNELILSLIMNDGKTTINNPKFRLLQGGKNDDLLSVIVEGVELLMPFPLQNEASLFQNNNYFEYTQEDFEKACSVLFHPTK